MGKTNISWCDQVWNPISGCSHISPGCENCYAENLATGRLKGKPGYPGLPWTAANAKINVVLHPERLDEPLRLSEPQRIFVCSMSDLFHEQVSDKFIAAVYGVMARARQHTFCVLTKRPARALKWYRQTGIANPDTLQRPLGAEGARDLKRPLSNVHLGVSVEDQPNLDLRWPILRQIPAVIRFLSLEPLLGPLDLRGVLALWNCTGCTDPRSEGTHQLQITRQHPSRAGWVIIGAESGPRYRPMKMEWARSLIEQCRAAGVATFIKQDNGPRPGMQGRFTAEEWTLKELP